jgi:hypothetical protein
MRTLSTKLEIQVTLLLLLCGAAAPLRAQQPSGAHLYVCNKGTVPVEVVAAQKNDPVIGKLYWDVNGITVSPRECKHVYGTTYGYPAYIGFGLADAKGQWGSGHIARVPDVGTIFGLFRSQKVLTGAAVALCAQKDATGYRTDGDLSANCAGLKYMTDFSGHLTAPDASYGPLLPLTSALFFQAGQTCTEAGLRSDCDYYLNVSPSAAGRELRATVGTDDGAEDAKDTGGDTVGSQVLKAIAKAVVEDGQKQAQRQAQVANAAPAGGFVRFKDGCNAFYRDPANARLSMSDAPGWCACLSEQYRNLMTPEEEAKYANDYGRLFHAGIAQPWGYGLSKSDPAWPRLHPAVDQCAR